MARSGPLLTEAQWKKIAPPFHLLASPARPGIRGRLAGNLGAFLSELNDRQQLKWSESFLDGSFAPAKR
jgi:hypothetical protein